MKNTLNKILLLDDSSSTNLYNTIILKEAGLASSIVSFQMGPETLDYLESIEKEQIPELILLDLNMPLMDGWEFLDQLTAKLNAAQLNKVKVIICSASLNPDHQKKSKGYDSVIGFIHKPLEIEALHQFFK